MLYPTVLALGLALITGRVSAILGGATIPSTEDNFAVAIMMPGMESMQTSFICSGVLISDYTVLTIAECVSGAAADDITVRTGKVPSTYFQHKVSKIITHSAFNSDTLANDLAIIHLATPATKMTKARLATTASYPSSCMKLVGWGPTKNNTQGIASALQGAEVEVIPAATCATQLKTCYNLNTAQHFCTNSSGKGGAYGDAGGPVVSPSGRVVGLISGNPTCAQPNGIALEVMVGNFHSWIVAHTK